MNRTNKQKLIKSATGVIIALILIFTSSVKIPILDRNTDSYFQDAIKKAGIAYASCRIVNGSVSVIQNSTLQLEPAGVGISLAAGQILDPVDDMTERLSDVLVTAITSLGVQKLAYEISISFAPPIIAILLLIMSFLIWFKNERIASMQQNLLRIIVFVMVARFCLPVSSLVNDMLQKHYFEDRIEYANEQLTLGSAELDKFKDFTLPEINGFRGTIENSSRFMKQKAKELKNVLSVLSKNMEKIIENLLSLTFLYVGIFIIQVIILPILSFWIMVKLANSLFRTNLPVILKHSKAGKNPPEEEM